MARWVLGDVHGNYRALKQVMELSKFNYEEDELITIGDITDGHGEVYECVEELLKVRHRIDIRGNHDEWFQTWLETGLHSQRWAQGGKGTLKSYLKYCLPGTGKMEPKMDGKWLTNLNPGDIPEKHIKFFKEQINYHIDEDNNCFVHGGFDRERHVSDQDDYILYWDRDLFNKALSAEVSGVKLKMKDNFKKIFIGHTSTMNWSDRERNKSGIIIPGGKKITTPIKACNIINIDTGAGYTGPLTLMNIDTEEYYQSDEDLYPNEKSR